MTAPSAEAATPPETLSPGDLGVDPLPFEFTPGDLPSPLVISFPHVGLGWPADFLRPPPQVSFGRNADYEVQTLFPGAHARGAASLQAIFSRLLVDLNRADDDVRPELVPDHPTPRPRSRPTTGPAIPNRGVLWDTAVGNIPILAGPITHAELDLRLSRYHRPYHAAIELLLRRRIDRFGHAILLEAHSMPGTIPGDLIVGTLEGGSCAPEVQARALAALGARDPETGIAFDVRLNDPYRGGEIVRAFGRPERGIHALQVEVNRALYMDEANLVLLAPPGRADPPPRVGARMLTQRQRRLGALLRRLDDLVAALVALPAPASAERPTSASLTNEAEPIQPAQGMPADGDCLVYSAVPRLKSP